MSIDEERRIREKRKHMIEGEMHRVGRTLARHARKGYYTDNTKRLGQKYERLTTLRHEAQEHLLRAYRR